MSEFHEFYETVFEVTVIHDGETVIRDLADVVRAVAANHESVALGERTLSYRRLGDDEIPDVLERAGCDADYFGHISTFDEYE